MADDYWVVASLSNQQAALREVNRLSSETGMIVEVSAFSKAGNHYHRLLITAQDMDAGLRQQLADMGIEPWRLSLDPTRVSLPDPTLVFLPDAIDYREHEAMSDGFLTDAPLASKSGHFLFVAASYPEVETALDVERNLASIFKSVRGETALVDGKIFHRVLVGPITFDEIEATRSALEGEGFENAWLVNGVADNAFDETNVYNHFSVRPGVKDVRIVVPVIKIPKKHSNPSGYNLARLPEKNPEFKL